MFVFENVELICHNGDVIDVEQNIEFKSVNDLYGFCIEEAEEYGLILEKVNTRFLDENCTFSLNMRTGELKVDI
jgi:hypothetical protein